MGPTYFDPKRTSFNSQKRSLRGYPQKKKGKTLNLPGISGAPSKARVEEALSSKGVLAWETEAGGSSMRREKGLGRSSRKSTPEGFTFSYGKEKEKGRKRVVTLITSV